MNVGPQKICFNLLLRKVKELAISDTMSSFAQMVLFLFSLLIMISFISGAVSVDWLSRNIDVILQEIFLKVVSQLFVLKACKDHFCVKKQLLEDSMTRTIDIALEPKAHKKKWCFDANFVLLKYKKF